MQPAGLPLICFFILQFLYAVHGQATVFVWTLNTTFTIDSSSSGAPFLDERRSLTVYPFGPQANDSSDGASADSTGIVFPCFVASNHSSTLLLSSAIFAVCMRPSPAGYFLSIDSPFQGTAILWAANRGSSARGSSLSLTLKSDGNLVFYSDGKIELPVWSSGTSAKGVVRMEVTENPANLKLVNLHNRTVWQSLDYPLDTLSVGQSLEVGKKLVSWVSGSDFSEGKFSLVVEPNYQLKLFYNSDDGDLSADYVPYWIWYPNDKLIPAACQSLDIDSAAYMSCLNPNGTANASHDYKALISTDGFSVGSRINGTTRLSTVLSSEISEYDLQTSVLRLDFDGGLRLYSIKSTWILLADLFANDSCLLPTRCGSFGVCTSNGQCACPEIDEDHTPSAFAPLNYSDPSQGCVLAQQPLSNCSVIANQSNNLSILMQPLKGGIDYFANKYSTPIVLKPLQGIWNATDQACADLCLHNCSCFAAFWHVDSRSCFHGQQQIGSFRGALNMANYKAYVKISITLSLSPTTTPVEAPHGHSKINGVATSIGCGIAGFLLALILLAFLYRKHYINVQAKGEKLGKTDTDFLDAHVFPDLPARYSYKDLDAATYGFSHKLGRGGFGAVYLGTLPDGLRIAVKKLEGLRQGDKEFWSELVIMGGLHHYNLLQLLGFCAEKEERLLVYKYMENGSLDQWIFGSDGSSSEACELQQDGDCNGTRLSWEMRYGIAVGVARGLAYLHEGCRKHILHLDIKPQNILLDDRFVAKVADFGLSRPMERDESHVVTTMRGTPGYLAPEWLKEGGTISVKCDVFSYGMLLMEIVSGRKNVDQRLSMVSYPEWAFSQLVEMKPCAGGACALPIGDTEEWSIEALTNAKLHNKEDREQLRRLIITAFMCVLEKPEWRPSMGTVVQMLEGHVPVSDIDLSALRPGLTFILGNGSSSRDLAELKHQLLVFFSLSGDSISADSTSVDVSAR